MPGTCVTEDMGALANRVTALETLMDDGLTALEGKSAYDLAVEAGFVGTESAWLASLEGPAGIAGPPGISGGVTPKMLHAVGASQAVVVLMSDDGYRSVYTNAYPITSKYGQVVTVAVEIDRVGCPYTVNDPTHGWIDHPTCTAADYRELISAGWEVGNHPVQATGSTLPAVIQQYDTENENMRKLLTGALVSTGTLGAHAAGVVTNPEYADYPMLSGTYRGGVNDYITDLACSVCYQVMRDVTNVNINWPYAYRREDGAGQRLTGYTIDTSSGHSLNHILSLLEGIAATDGVYLLYFHHVPDDSQATSSPPSCKKSDFEAICKKIWELGIRTTTLSKAFQGNLLYDSRHVKQAATFTAAAGDSAGYQTGTNYIGESRVIRLVTTANQGNYGTTSATWQLGVQPFRKYKVRLACVIPADLVLQGGTSARHQGIQVGLATSTPAGHGYSGGTSEAYTIMSANVHSSARTGTSASSVTIGLGPLSFTFDTAKTFYERQLVTIYVTADYSKWVRGYVVSYNSSTGAMSFFCTDYAGTGNYSGWSLEAGRLPFRSTGGQVVFHDFYVTSLHGGIARLTVGLLNCIGSVDIAAVTVEDLGDFELCGLSFINNFNTSADQAIALPVLGTTGPVIYKWQAEVSVFEAAPAVTTVNYAESDSASIGAPANGQTCYVLGKGATAFANQGGMIATYNAGSWTFAAPTAWSVIKATLSEGIANRRFQHYTRSALAGAINRPLGSDNPGVEYAAKVNGSIVNVSNFSGLRTDEFLLTARPVRIGLPGFST